MKVGEVVQVIERDGWVLVRQRGSHRQFKHATKRGVVTIAGNPGTEVPIGTLKSVLQTGRTREERIVTLRYVVLVEEGPASWGAHVPDLPGCVAVGRTREEVLDEIRSAIALHIEGLRADGADVPTPSDSEIVEITAA